MNVDSALTRGVAARCTAIALAALVTILVAGCVTLPQGAPTEAERSQLRSGALAMVMVRVELDIDVEVRAPWAWSESKHAGRFVVPMDGRRIDPMHLRWVLGSFETAGWPVLVSPRVLSAQSRANGWSFFMLTPGIYYLGLSKVPYSAAEHAQDVIWRVDVSPGARIVYAGSVRIRARGMGREPTNVTWIHTENVSVADDVALVSSQLVEHGLNPADMTVALFRRWRDGDPLVFRAPLKP